MTSGEQKAYLRNAGWTEIAGTSPWCWSDPLAKGAWYRLGDAVELELSRGRDKTGRKRTKRPVRPQTQGKG